MHCSTVQGKMQSAGFIAALQNRLTAGTVSCSHTFGVLFFTQVCNETTFMHCNTGNMLSTLFFAALKNSVEQALRQCSYTCGVLRLMKVRSEPTQCTATLVRAKCIPHYSLLLFKKHLH